MNNPNLLLLGLVITQFLGKNRNPNRKTLTKQREYILWEADKEHPQPELSKWQGGTCRDSFSQTNLWAFFPQPPNSQSLDKLQRAREWPQNLHYWLNQKHSEVFIKEEGTSFCRRKVTKNVIQLQRLEVSRVILWAFAWGFFQAVYKGLGFFKDKSESIIGCASPQLLLFSFFFLPSSLQFLTRRAEWHSPNTFGIIHVSINQSFITLAFTIHFDCECVQEWEFMRWLHEFWFWHLFCGYVFYCCIMKASKYKSQDSGSRC